MRPRERFGPDDPLEWLKRARSNLARARHRIPGTYLEDACFDAQQAAEKAIKAVMVFRDIEFPYIHELARLIDILESAGDPIPDGVRRAGRLTRYATATRYPGLEEPVTEREYAEAVEIAEAVLRWAESLL
ncbi:MAG: HEPN domain-containing protein [Gemmatimonadetes bacterium]|nr:HEPN domain-containing protein [Gemmatimonadota bacterium]MYD14086.1 HEPN domain-containing protein [Gemmatimonadota bacterium]MYI66856.1 HEPN domain-containing protein [Gemmatimonadota bacterium]